MNWESMFCPCCGSLKVESKDLIRKINSLESKWESQNWNLQDPPILVISSGYRCEKHNAEVGGSHLSQHLLGRAADIARKDGQPMTDSQALALEKIAAEVGFTGICPYSHHIHVDVRVGEPWRDSRRWIDKRHSAFSSFPPQG